MNQPTLSRLGAACGAVFAIVLTLAAGNGNESFSGPRAVAGIAAITLALPFIAYLCGVLRQAGGADGWLVSAAFAAGITSIVLKLGSGAPELAMHKAHLIAGTQLNSAISAIADGVTVISPAPQPPEDQPHERRLVELGGMDRDNLRRIGSRRKLHAHPLQILHCCRWQTVGKFHPPGQARRNAVVVVHQETADAA